MTAALINFTTNTFFGGGLLAVQPLLGGIQPFEHKIKEKMRKQSTLVVKAEHQLTVNEISNSFYQKPLCYDKKARIFNTQYMFHQDFVRHLNSTVR